MDWLEDAVDKQRSYIEGFLIEPMAYLAVMCSMYWSDSVKLDEALRKYLDRKTDHRCRLLYVIDKEGCQRSSNISDKVLDRSIIGQDLSSRPYLDHLNQLLEKRFILSDVYVDRHTRKPCITALHRVIVNDEVQGFIAADFGLMDLPLRNIDSLQSQEWRQLKGDPSIRSNLFQQTRTQSAMDRRLDEVFHVIELLMSEQGIFHAKLHFSSSRATLWSFDDPYHYRIHVLDEIINPDMGLVYAKNPYPEKASVGIETIPKILKVFKALRESDETIYLRAASLNIMNGLVGLNFSCDGSHYMPVEEFLCKDEGFWFGKNDNAIVCNA